jgi:phosphoglycerate dehydrogenase-like enzyme
VTSAPPIALGPASVEPVEAAILAGGGRLAAPEEAKGVVWLDPSGAEGLKDMLEGSPASWVQLPFAGIETFFDAGVITPDRTWTCTKGAYGTSTAEHALALVLAAARHLHEHVKARSWRPGFGKLGAPERRLKDSTVLVVGTGGIGSALVRMLDPLGPRVLASNRSGRPLEAAEQTVPSDRLGEVLPEADFVVIAASLTSSTRGMFDRAALEAMKPSAWLVNVARGGLVDTAALVDALEAGTIGGAALDVTEPEPLPDGHPLWAMTNCIITPHVANTADMALPELVAMIERNVAHYVRGEQLEGVVDVSLGY